MTNYERLVFNIKRIIEEKGIKQMTVAKRAGFKDKEFSNLMNGRKVLKAEHIPQIAYALEVEPNDLFNITVEVDLNKKQAS